MLLVYLMMPLKILQSKEIDLKQMPMMSESTDYFNSDHGSVEWQNDCI